ncbi:MAG: MerR family transcriptional regulator [Acutalibacteraceae bacterium]|nr:MerR family transcriptional regulator [Acutalibacteraceae bacterium]
MSKYTTGEIAKICGVSVRTVQYYDSRNLLVPSELTEGGRRLYNDDDLRKMKIICFLREAGLPINSIIAMFQEDNTNSIISVLLEQQEQSLKEEVQERQKQLSIIESIKKEMKEVENFSVESIGDIANFMKNKNQLTKMRIMLVLTGTPVTILFWVTLAMWITMGMWWLFALWLIISIIYGICVSKYYFEHTAYICPECHEVFKPSFKDTFFAYHTPKMRRLTCPKCNHKSLCIEIYAEKENNSEKN